MAAARPLLRRMTLPMVTCMMRCSLVVAGIENVNPQTVPQQLPQSVTEGVAHPASHPGVGPGEGQCLQRSGLGSQHLLPTVAGSISST